jgi:tetratricopeptide (TPR) repeat protein
MSLVKTSQLFRHKLSLILVSITAVLLFLVTQSQALIDNLYLRYVDYKWNQVELSGLSKNDELQDGFPDRWLPRTWNSGRAVFRSESSEVHSGNYSVRVEKTSTRGVAGLSQTYVVPDGAVGVSLSVFAKGAGGAAQIRFIFEDQINPVNGGWQAIPPQEVWQQYQVDKPLPDDVRQVEVLLRSNGITYFDDAFFGFRLENGEMPNILENAGFEIDGIVQDPLIWWQEHAVLPDMRNVPDKALAGELPFLNILDMLNGRYENIHQRIALQSASCSTTPEMTSWLLDLAPEIGAEGGASAKEKLFQLAISLAPNCPQPYAQLGRLYEENGVYVSAAEQYRLAAELSGDTPLAGYYYFNEGLIHVRHTGNLEEAIFTLEKAETLEAWVTGIVFQGASAYHLGLAYKNAGLEEEAAKSFQRVIDCDFCVYYQEGAKAELAALESE